MRLGEKIPNLSVLLCSNLSIKGYDGLRFVKTYGSTLLFYNKRVL